MKVLMSIKPKYAEQIKSGSKKFEFRRSIFKKNVDRILVYITAPVSKIIGEIIIDDIITDTLKNVWDKTKEYSGVTEEEFYNYFNGKEKANAIKIKEFIKYETPINPYETWDNFTPPQSFKYVSE